MDLVCPFYLSVIIGSTNLCVPDLFCMALVFLLQAGDWARVSPSARHYFSTYITNMDWHQDLVQHAILGVN